MLMTVFLTPLSVNLRDVLTGREGLSLSLPTEPILFGIMIIYIFKSIREINHTKKLMRHPITIAIVIQLVWMFITCITSTIPLVSFKAFTARLWFVTAFYFMANELFKKKSNIKKFYWMYIISFLLVIFYTIYNHAHYNFSEDAAHWVMTPFFNDHTAYGALLAMYFPVILGFVFNKKDTKTLRILSFGVLVIFLVAIILSYTRAAWVGLAGALAVYIVLLLKIKFRSILILLGFLTLGGIVFQTQIEMKLEQNHQDSSRDFSKHLESISNISSDASNLERLNRWSCALRMFEEKPIVGWGPGTYSFKYAPFQLASDRTIISTDNGDRGNAHSEYFGPLCESGVLGFITFVVIVLSCLSTGFRLFYTVKDKETRLLALVAILGLVTYFVHGTVNDFLDTDKASIPFWGFIAVLTAIDLHHNKKSENLNTLHTL